MKRNTDLETDHDEGLFPSDLFGRFACLIVGTFFGIPGVGILALLISNRRGLDALVIYELSICASLFGTSLVLWGLFRAHWIERLGKHVVSHTFLVAFFLLLPFAVKAIPALFR